MHVTIQEGTSLPEITKCISCCSNFHCPFCSTAHFKPTKLSKVRTHLDKHFTRAVLHQGDTIHRCGLDCRPHLHYHCIYCQSMLSRRADFMVHLALCKEQSAGTASTVPSSATATIPAPIDSNTILPPATTTTSPPFTATIPALTDTTTIQPPATTTILPPATTTTSPPFTTTIPALTDTTTILPPATTTIQPSFTTTIPALTDTTAVQLSFRCRHVTCQEGRSLPEITKCISCCNDFHCPFCSTAHFKPTKLSKVRTHLDKHFARAVLHQGDTIHRCGLDCRPHLHYHCINCQSTLSRRADFIIHLALCKEQSAVTASTVPSSATTTIPTLTDTTTILPPLSTTILPPATTTTSPPFTTTIPALTDSTTILPPATTTIQPPFTTTIPAPAFTAKPTAQIGKRKRVQNSRPRTVGSRAAARTVKTPRKLVTRRPSCSFIMNTRCGMSLLQLSSMGVRLCSSKAPHRSRAFGLTKVTSTCLPDVSALTPALTPGRRPYSSSIKVRSYLDYVKRKIKPPPSPPYSHVCQVGDPVLRSHAAAVDPAVITGPEVQEVIQTLVKVMRKMECVGLSAPQIGVPLRILAVEYPERMLRESSPTAIAARGLCVQPLRIFINPQLRVLDGNTVRFQEACESISGFSATVPRYLSVEVSGLNEKGEEVTWQASGWPARIVQHEMDHLDGVLYIDHMDTKTFINIHWPAANE